MSLCKVPLINSKTVSNTSLPMILPISTNTCEIQNSFNTANQNNIEPVVIKNKSLNKKRKYVRRKKIYNSLIENENKPKRKCDFYTPRYVKGKGIKRIGKCPCCPQQPGIWYKTKTSAYRYYYFLYIYLLQYLYT